MDLPLSGQLISIESLVTLILALVALEAIGLFLLARIWPRAPRFLDLVGNLFSGACLVLAVKLVIDSAPPPLILLCLTGSLVGHSFDLARQMRRNR